MQYTSSMDDVLVVRKEIGETPLEVIERVRGQMQIDASVRMAYAGRLDPMADGALLLLVGDACDRRKEFEGLDKEYEFALLLGVETDTYDVMGVVQTDEFRVGELASCGLDQVQAQLKSFVGHFEQEYPPYSSARVGGHPLFWWARAGRLDEIVLPTHTVTVTQATLTGEDEASLQSVVQTVTERVRRVARGDFRQDAVIASWEQFLARSQPDIQLPIYTIQTTCSSGTYVRSICHTIGRRLGCGAIAYRITRARIGSYHL